MLSLQRSSPFMTHDRAIRSDTENVFQTLPVDGIAQIPAKPGIYAMLNRVTRKINIGQSKNMHHRCVLHRAQLKAGTSANLRIRRDTELHGADVWFFFVLATLKSADDRSIAHKLDRLEVYWVVQLQAHDERYGYVSEAGHCSTMGARFRDRERKLLRRNSERYELLPGTDINDPISPILLSAWSPGS